MEWKIGEIRQVDGEWYQCVSSSDCPKCDLKHIACCRFKFPCESLRRNDCEEVIFKKLEKVGKPYSCNYYGDDRLVMMQEYNLYNLDVAINGDKIPMYIPDYKHKRIAIEFKNNEDMEEKKIKISKEDSDYLLDKLCYILDERVCGEGSDEVITDIKKLLDIDSEDIESNLKPFNLEAAKAGKPVCTRDGRKARIICFDAKFSETGNIVTLVEKENGEEVTLYHYDDGHCSIGRGYDLFMLSEKKTGWINLPRDTFYFDKKEIAEKNCLQNYSTVKIEWEE